MAAPKLRFKAFIKPYKNIKYEEFAPLQRGFDLPVSTIVDGEYPVVFSNGILKKHNSFKAKAPGVVTGRSGTIGNITWVDKDYWPHNTSLWVTNFFDNDPRYTFYFLQDFDVSRFASGSGVPTLNRNDVHAQLIHIPTDRNEQSKIATFLSAVDEKITQLTQKHQLLSQYKQGMMQKLFGQQIRFKADDGSEFEEWEEKQLGDVCHFINGRAYKQTEWEKEGTPVIRLQNLTGSGKEYYYSTLNLPDHQYCYNNDLLYMWSATFGPIFWQGEKAIFHYHIWKVEVEPQQLDKQYMYYLLDEMTEKMKSGLNGSTMLHVTKQGMESTKKNLPSIEEQTKIANFLSAIDQKIDVVSEQLEQAKLWKKGLLQQMFV
jgi:restriction endonuclease S subunit